MADEEWVWVEVSPGRQRRVRKSDIEGVATKSGEVFFFRGSDLSKKDQRSLSRIVGAPVYTMDDARRVMAEKGLRFVERGEFNQKIRKGIREWRRDCPGATRLPPELQPNAAFKPRAPRPDIRAIYREVRQRLGRG